MGRENQLVLKMTTSDEVINIQHYRGYFSLPYYLLNEISSNCSLQYLIGQALIFSLSSVLIHLPLLTASPDTQVTMQQAFSHHLNHSVSLGLRLSRHFLLCLYRFFSLQFKLVCFLTFPSSDGSSTTIIISIFLTLHPIKYFQDFVLFQNSNNYKFFVLKPSHISMQLL